MSNQSLIKQLIIHQFIDQVLGGDRPAAAPAAVAPASAPASAASFRTRATACCAERDWYFRQRLICFAEQPAPAPHHATHSRAHRQRAPSIFNHQPSMQCRRPIRKRHFVQRIFKTRTLKRRGAARTASVNFVPPPLLQPSTLNAMSALNKKMAFRREFPKGTRSRGEGQLGPTSSSHVCTSRVRHDGSLGEFLD